jgi:hypothetical protein
VERLLGFDGDAEQTGKVRVDLFPFLNQAFASSDSVVDIHVQSLPQVVKA